MSGIDPTKAKREESKQKSKKVGRSPCELFSHDGPDSLQLCVYKVLGRMGIADLDLSEHESIIAAEVVHPQDISVKFEDIGGLDAIIDDLKETVIYPLTFPQLFVS